MQVALLAQMLALTALGPQVSAISPGSNALGAEPIGTRQTLFAIPFSVDNPEQMSQEPIEVQLLVSADRGQSWQLYSRVEPTRRQFLFRAGADGEYWFRVCTVDRNGRLHTQPPGSPELHVVVDTTPPKLDLSAQQGSAGEIIASWQIDEAHLKPGSLTLQYRNGEAGSWQSVAIGLENQRSSGTMHHGQVTWWPQAGSGDIQIRAEVSDSADNPAVSHAQVRVQRVAGSTPHRMGPAPGAEQSPDAWRASSERPRTPWPVEDAPAAGSDPPFSAVPGSVSPPIANRYVNTQKPVAAKEAGMPLGERPRMVNSRLFELDYDVDAVGPSGISRVELWGTQDSGQTWRSFALDDDNRSPLLVSVDEEGIYGFRVTITTGAGLGGQPPKPGALPEIFVGVDLTKPSARITAAEQGVGAESGKLVISWTADDQRLDERPISLAFSESPGGPWTTVASGLENTGRYVWPLDNRVPGQIYLRLEVRDEAGNIAGYETHQSVSLDRMRPAVHIRDIRPLNRTGSKPGPKRYHFR